MNYIGSKQTLIPFITSVVETVVGKDLSDKVFCDIFAGTGAVGRAFKPRVKKVIANDWEYYSYVLNRNYIGNHLRLDGADALIDELNNIQPLDSGFIYVNYCPGNGSGRNYFSDENGKRIDAIRVQIENWKEERAITEDVYYFLLASLLESADKVANTASVYGAFLKHLKKTAQKPLLLTPALFSVNANTHEVSQEEANTFINKVQGDILYLDPPYNARQYGANYHLLNTIAEYKPFIPKGKTGLRDNYRRSSYCSKKAVPSLFESLIKNARFKYIFLSYNNEGLMPMSLIRSLMQKYGRYELASQEHTRFRADREDRRNYRADKTTEYLHILEKY